MRNRILEHVEMKRKMLPRYRLIGYVLLAAVLVWPSNGVGQDGAADVPAADAPAAQQLPAQQPADTPVQKKQTPPESIGGMIVSGGVLNIVFFGVLGIFSLWAATVVIERCFHLRKQEMLPASFESQLAQITQTPQRTTGQFQRLCDLQDVSASRILQAGLIRSGRPVPEVEKAMEDAAAREMAMLRAKSRPLSVVGSIAPLVGLLGTVVGMIMAFQVSSQEGLGKAERLAEGIYLALMTTAAGLAIAIPCLLFASRFQARAEQYMCDIADCLSKTLPSFMCMEGKPAISDSPTVDPDLSARERFLREGVTGPSD